MLYGFVVSPSVGEWNETLQGTWKESLQGEETQGTSHQCRGAEIADVTQTAERLARVADPASMLDEQM